MSLLEDIFLADEANEAQELERVIEGDEYDERARDVSESDSDNNGNREDEAEEDKRRVDPTSTKTKRVTKNPRFILNPARLTGPRGIQVIPELFKDFKFKGKGHEKDDLDMVLKKLEHWAYRLYPKFEFKDCLKKIETLGKKRPVMVHLHKIRTDQFMSEETVVQKDSSDDEALPPQEEDEFDKLLQQQIDLARATPAPDSVKKADRSDQWAKVIETPNRGDRSIIPMPKATSSPSISDEQKERMIRNRKLAEERRLARLKQAAIIDNTPPPPPTIMEIDENEVVKTTNNEIDDVTTTISRKNKSNVIDSSDSDEDCNVTAVNESVVVDIHNGVNVIEKSDKVVKDNDVEKENQTAESVEEVNEIAQNYENSMDDVNKNIEGVNEIAQNEDENAIADVQNKESRVTIDVPKLNNDVNDEIINNIVSDSLISVDKIKTDNNVSNLPKNNEIIEEVTEIRAKTIENVDYENVMDVDFSDDF